MAKIVFRDIDNNEKDLGWRRGATANVPQHGDEVRIHFDDCPRIFSVVKNRFTLLSGSQHVEEVIDCLVRFKSC